MKPGLAGAVALAALMLSGCGSNQAEAPAPVTPVAAVSPEGFGPPPNSCLGIRDFAAALRVVIGGEAKALVKVVVPEDPSSTSSPTQPPIEGWGYIPLADVRFEAGRLPDGTPHFLYAEIPPLTSPGHYLLLLAPAKQPGVYWISSGANGTFVDDGDAAYQVCPDYGVEDGHFSLVKSGVTHQRHLIHLLSRALTYFHVHGANGGRQPEFSHRS
jgi:hypothetical protein